MKKFLFSFVAVSMIAICLFSFSACTYSDSSREFSGGFSTTNNGFAKDGAEVEKLISITPSERQLAFQEIEYYNFVHFGMNTFTDREWGDGTESPETFCPENVDTDQWAEAIAASGSKGIIFTAKHHDGFCLWQTKYTEHSVKNSPYKNGNGDIVKELSESCKKYGLKFGVYLSPWDRHEPTYGTKAYDDFYVAQLEELLTNYGDIFAVWMDGAKGDDAPDFEYDFERYFATVRRLQPSAVVSVKGPDVRWIGNENGKCRDEEWSVVSKNKDYNSNSQTGESDRSNLAAIPETAKDLGSRKALSEYSAEDLVWYPAEADISIRRKVFSSYGGWFYHKKEFNKSANKLFKIYLDTVGRNASLLLNVPPTKEGVLDDDTVKKLKKFGDKLRDLYSDPVPFVAYTGSVEKGMNENPTATALSSDNQKNDFMLPSDEDIIDLKLDGSKKINYLVIKENLAFSQRVERFDVYVRTSTGKWRKAEECSVIGNKRIVKIGKKTAAIRIFIRQSRGNPHFRHIALY